MINSLYSFFVVDRAARWRALLWSWAMGTIAGAVVSATDLGNTALATASIGTSITILAILTARYIYLPRASIVVKSRRDFTSYACAASVGVMFSIVERMLRSPQAVHAAVGEVFDDIRANKTVSPAKLVTLQSQVQKILGEHKTGRIRDKALYDYAVVKAGLVYSQKNNPADLSLPEDAHRDTSTGRSSFVFRPAIPTVMISVGCNSGSSSIDFINATSGSSLVLPHNGCPFVIIDSTITGFTQKLDGLVCIEVTFDNCSLTYSGGQLILVNVKMINCSIEISGNVPVSVRRMLESYGTITMTSDLIH